MPSLTSKILSCTMFLGIETSKTTGAMYSAPPHARFFYALSPGYSRHVQGASLKAVNTHSQCYGGFKPRSFASFETATSSGKQHQALKAHNAPYIRSNTHPYNLPPKPPGLTTGHPRRFQRHSAGRLIMKQKLVNRAFLHYQRCTVRKLVYEIRLLEMDGFSKEIMDIERGLLRCHWKAYRKAVRLAW